MAKPPVAEQVQVNFRMPAPLRDRIRFAAAENGRSMNAEIIEALEKVFPEPETVEDVVDGVINKLLEARPELLERAAELIGSLASSGELKEYTKRFKIETSKDLRNPRRVKVVVSGIKERSGRTGLRRPSLLDQVQRDDS